MLTQVIVTFRSAPIYSRISCHQSASTTCTHEITDCGNAFALDRSFEARMGMPIRQNINSTWLFDEVTAEILCLQIMIGAICNPLVQPARVETACDASLLTISTQKEESFLQSMFERVSCSFPELFSLALALGCTPSAASCTCSNK